MATSWRLSAGQRLRRRQWDGECVLYNDLSGDTHLIGPDALQLLLALQERPADADALARALLAAGLAQDAGEVPALLDQLERLALVEVVC
ncbi:PqqD family protein of HPr-rel-A system [Duganella sp. 1411]|uniref:HPr-rel-A system PqqD family peptide chaperone n=1 Tax=Duganella sp. 1411 TaxID=2806572 RepID=UPI001AE62B78|nr:HPr-rel-A system PqqD family peptide chaperone [Duganella sp. 1411]MBP1202260.1 PqqD family protein of HPr-rel-A system [Duganella sp. 1411]